MRAVPTRKRVGAETRVHQSQRALHQGIVQVGIESGDLFGQKHAFINQRLVGQAGDIPVTRLQERQVGNDVRRAFADDIQLALEGHVVLQRAPARDEHLPDERLRRFGGGAERRIIRWNGAPTDDLQAFFFDDLLKRSLALLPFGRVLRQENEAGAILTGLRKLEAEFITLLLEEGMRYLHQEARTVARVGFAPAGPAMVQVPEHLQRLLNDLVRLLAFDVDHEADAAGFVFEKGIIEALLASQAVRFRVRVFHFRIFMAQRVLRCRGSRLPGCHVKI